MKTWGWPDEPSQTLTKASDSMAQDCVRGGGRVTAVSRGTLVARMVCVARVAGPAVRSVRNRGRTSTSETRGRDFARARAFSTGSEPRSVRRAQRRRRGARILQEPGRNILLVTRVADSKLDGICRDAQARQIEHFAKRQRDLLRHGYNLRLVLC